MNTMIIHVVKPKETIYSIADYYKVPVSCLIIDNGIKNPEDLVIGQTIVIEYPEQIYRVKEGDTLLSVANAYGVSVQQVLRNNPYLSDRNKLIPGETLIISYKKSDTKLSTNGYAYPFIDKAILKKTLPFLTYLSIFNYRATAEGDLIGIDDTELIKTARENGVAPVMLISTLTIQGTGSFEASYNILNDEALVNKNIESILNTLKQKGYYALNITFQYINNQNLSTYNNFILRLTKRLNAEGYPVWVTFTPRTLYESNEITFEKINYKTIGEMVERVMLLSYSWGYTFGPPTAPASASLVKQYLDYTVSLVSPNKIFIGIPVIGYDWQLPYEIGVSKANSLTTDSAIELARQKNVTIKYDENSQAPFFMYEDRKNKVPVQHIVWFKDARSIRALTNLVPIYNFPGIGIWNIMDFFAQMWFIINTQYEIEKIPLEKIP